MGCFGTGWQGATYRLVDRRWTNLIEWPGKPGELLFFTYTMISPWPITEPCASKPNVQTMFRCFLSSLLWTIFHVPSSGPSLSNPFKRNINWDPRQNLVRWFDLSLLSSLISTHEFLSYEMNSALQSLFTGDALHSRPTNQPSEKTVSRGPCNSEIPCWTGSWFYLPIFMFGGGYRIPNKRWIRIAWKWVFVIFLSFYTHTIAWPSLCPGPHIIS